MGADVTHQTHGHAHLMLSVLRMRKIILFWACSLSKMAQRVALVSIYSFADVFALKGLKCMHLYLKGDWCKSRNWS